MYPVSTYVQHQRNKNHLKLNFTPGNFGRKEKGGFILQKEERLFQLCI